MLGDAVAWRGQDAPCHRGAWAAALRDGGCVWSAVSPRTVLSLAADGLRVYAGTDAGVMRSDDGGETWTDLPMAPLHDLHRLLLVDGAPLVAGTHSPPVIGDRGGWTVLTATPLPSTGMFVAPNGTPLCLDPRWSASVQ